VRVAAIADSDSYVKWAAASLSALPTGVDRDLLVVTTPAVVSDAQLTAALAGSGLDPAAVSRIEHGALCARLSSLRPDVVLVATRGPVATVILRMLGGLRRPPVLVSGLPGISIPATPAALAYRRQADLFILHSRREVREFQELAVRVGWDQRFALATLPFLESRRSAFGDDLVFATQAIVPATLGDRRRVVEILVDAARADPSRRVVVKLRAVAGEKQTHAERIGYPELLAQVSDLPANLVVSSGPMSVALDTAAGLVTVSSTAALEAVGRGIPVIALDDFGISDRLINSVFVGSGLFGGRDAVLARSFRVPRAEWLADNYFHDPGDEDWIEALMALVVARGVGSLRPRPAPVRAGGSLRRAWERKRAFGSADRSIAGAAALVVGAPASMLARSAARLARAAAGNSALR
jgi:hypothetical protein